MAEQPAFSFAALLRQLRAEAQLTQEELAEAARISPRAVSDLERGINRTARKDTAMLLVSALGLDGPAGERFVAAARGRAPAEDVLTARQAMAAGSFVASATRALPRDIPSFTGRQAELTQLMRALAAEVPVGGVVGIHAIDGMAGVGKTTFAVHAAHRLAEGFPDGPEGEADRGADPGLWLDSHQVRGLGNTQPSFAGFVTTEDHGVLEFLLVFQKS